MTYTAQYMVIRIRLHRNEDNLGKAVILGENEFMNHLNLTLK